MAKLSDVAAINPTRKVKKANSCHLSKWPHCL